MRVVICATLVVIVAFWSAGCNEPADTIKDVVEVAPDTVDAVSCPDGLVPWDNLGVCGPALAVCENPWEMPTVTGECVAIGPRGCPKLWNPESTADCEPGELLLHDGADCPEGFVLTDDKTACIPFFEETCGEMEVAKLGGGCQKIGVTVEELGLVEPVFDDCAENEIALAGGGCAVVGPRACEKLWDPDSLADCQPGDLLPCPEGWHESEDTLFCEPSYVDCPTDEGEPATLCPAALAVQECPTGPFPEPPAGVTDILYVDDDSDCEAGCGDQAQPFPSMAAALQAAPEGAAILVAEGTYHEGLTINQSQRLLGLCAAKVKLTGTVAVGDSDPGSMAAVVIAGGVDVELSGLRITSEGAGVWATSAAHAGIYGTLIKDCVGAGITVVGAGTSMTLADSAIIATAPSGTGNDGQGAVVAESAVLEISSAVLDANHSQGVWVTGGGELEMTGTAVRATSATNDPQSGVGILVQGPASAQVSESLIEDNVVAGAAAAGPGSSLVGNRIISRNNFVNSDGELGVGAACIEGGAMTVSGSLFTGNRSAGLASLGAASSLVARGSVVRKTIADDSGYASVGVVADLGGSVDLSHVSLAGNVGSGISVANQGSSATVTACVIRDSKPFPDLSEGAGIYVYQGGALKLSDSLILDNYSYGISASNPGSMAEATGCEIKGTNAPLGSLVGYGAVAGTGAFLRLEESLVRENLNAGVVASETNSVVEVFRCTLRDNIPLSGIGGFGGAAGYGGKLTVTESLVLNNSCMGLAAFVKEAELVVQSTVIAGTQPSAGYPVGHGIGLAQNAVVIVSDSLVTDSVGAGLFAGPIFEDLGEPDIKSAVVNRSVFKETGQVVAGDHTLPGSGIFLAGSIEFEMTDSKVSENHGYGLFIGQEEAATNQSSGSMTGSWINRTLSAPSGKLGAGVVVHGPVDFSVSESLLADNHGAGLVTTKAGSNVSLTSSTVRGSLSFDPTNPQIGGGSAVVATESARAVVDRCLFQDNLTIAVAALTGAEINMSGMVIADTGVSEIGFGTGGGVEAQSGGRIHVAGSLLARNTEFGAAAFQSGSVVTLAGVVVEDTMPNAIGHLSFGIAAVDGGDAVVTHSQVRRNSTAGVFVLNAQSAAKITHSSMQDTRHADPASRGTRDYQVYGDGAAVKDGALTMDSVLLLNNGRTGAYFEAASGFIMNAVVAGNSSYGLALEDCEAAVVVEQGSNSFFGNGIDLPPAQAADVTYSPGGLPVPAAPQQSKEPPPVSM